MGGASKKPISTMEKRLKKEAEKQQKAEEKKKGPSKTGKEIISRAVTIDEETKKKVLDEIKKESIITPYALATKSGISISVARKILKELENQNVVKLYSKNRRLEIYIAAS
ncbi:30S ribosomal protein S25e [Saccharolobus solfataricus]|uniref:Small ribosomal subunit protein eS25 n=3 Tax=Saccharolobus solfataricus TaxID=2287 RepID=RS25_SACS2|nr:30S ribosomal protein S25e [Saccharolobus solfataricus]Q97ZZ6.1 RecName: Full=Small ribosomal subunit protein eS25; AltName: Full=30S ribosomal protein S25e [Saccharolobus solfataricus P2]AAK40749.1 SSU ribosomal protein S25E (rps25E) [Saccharolobus solfataricus P2]AKA73725.1 30S ribosomal protein S25e [Saccharolobus solfataricus]AKA76422.1 30S ribosomal protein S25e [Saccharolobus solfataricus]AKA79115.1 30S ribosomal protein S25e [Saccharolobus solfataricus]AZF68196.1 30S ribosomal prote